MMIYLVSISFFSGTIDDGWSIDEQLGKNTRAIITQVRDPCPQNVNRSFVFDLNLDYRQDNSVNITCVQKPLEKSVEVEEEAQNQVLLTETGEQASYDSASHAKSTFSYGGISTQTVFLLSCAFIIII